MKLFGSKKSKLPSPISQLTETLYLLLKEPQTRVTFIQKAYILNAPDCVMKLRRLGVEIETTPINTVNKYGRPVNHCFYSLKDAEKAKQTYIDMVSEKHINK